MDFRLYYQSAMNPKAEEIRIRYLNRRKVLTGEVRVRLDAARKLVGPDCAYHLYGVMKSEDMGKSNVTQKRPSAKKKSKI